MDAAMWGRVTFLLMLPVGLLLTGGVWTGRLLLVSGGWFMVIFTVTLVPLMLVALVMSWIIALQVPERPRRLTVGETGAQLVTWSGAFGVGLFIVDFGDTEDSASSVFSTLVGNDDAVQSWSMALAGRAGRRHRVGRADRVPAAPAHCPKGAGQTRSMIVTFA